MSMKSIKSKQFKKDFKHCMKQNKDLSLLHDAMTALENGCNLEDYPEYNDHLLKGNYSNVRECHLGGRKSDWILLYEKAPDCIFYVATGSRSDIYGL